jgi:hypothetical protein
MTGTAACDDNGRTEYGGLLRCLLIAYDPIVRAHEHQGVDVTEWTARVYRGQNAKMGSWQIPTEQHCLLKGTSGHLGKIERYESRTLRVAQDAIEWTLLTHKSVEVLY